MYMFVNLDEFWGFPKVNYQKIIFCKLLTIYFPEKSFQRRICFLNNVYFRMNFHAETF